MAKEIYNNSTKIRKIQRISLIALTFFIPLVTIFYTLFKYDSINITKNTFQVDSNYYSINFYKGDLSKEILKISPLDDYYYKGSFKEHLFNNQTYKIGSYNKFWYINSFNKLINNTNHLLWSAEGKDFSVNYNIIENYGLFEVKRIFERIPQGVDSIGQTVIICDECFVSDNKKRVFIYEKNITPELVKSASKKGFTVVVLTEKLLPNDIHTINIVDTSLELKVSLNTYKGQPIFFNDQWKLLEIKTPLNQNTKTTNQIIKLY